eukprot:165487-Alexandrium_andersonii.AAC.1
MCAPLRRSRSQGSLPLGPPTPRPCSMLGGPSTPTRRPAGERKVGLSSSRESGSLAEEDEESES